MTFELSDNLVRVPVFDRDMALVPEVQALRGLPRSSRGGGIAHSRVSQETIEDLSSVTGFSRQISRETDLSHEVRREVELLGRRSDGQEIVVVV